METKKMRVETIAEFLARGGVIKRYPAAAREEETNKMPTETPNLDRWTLSDGEMFFGEGRMKSTKVKKAAKQDTNITINDINMNMIPDHIKAMLKTKE